MTKPSLGKFIDAMGNIHDIISWLDDDAEECEREHAVFGMGQRADGNWFVFRLDMIEIPKIH